MNEKMFYFFRFLAGLSATLFMHYVLNRSDWALYVGIVFAFSYYIYIEIALPKEILKTNSKNQQSKH